MGWQKRSSGNCYDSQSGHSYGIGLYRRKIIDSCTYCKVYNICEQARIKNLTPKKHYCTKNWEGPSKSMESSAIVEICARAPLRGLANQFYMAVYFLFGIYYFLFCICYIIFFYCYCIVQTYVYVLRL